MSTLSESGSRWTRTSSVVPPTATDPKPMGFENFGSESATGNSNGKYLKLCDEAGSGISDALTLPYALSDFSSVIIPLLTGSNSEKEKKGCITNKTIDAANDKTRFLKYPSLLPYGPAGYLLTILYASDSFITIILKNPEYYNNQDHIRQTRINPESARMVPQGKAIFTWLIDGY